VATPVGFRLGVDFGTSNTVAVLATPSGTMRQLLVDGAPVLPSAVCLTRDRRLLVGRDAVHAARSAPEGFDPNPRRRVDVASVRLGGVDVAVVDMIAAVLGRVVGEARRVAGGAIESATLTYPAGWDRNRLGVLHTAAARAGLAAPHLVPEPVAAGYSFLHAAESPVPVGSCVVVYDFGAVAFDAAVVRRTPTGFEVLATDGLPDTGGVNIDAAIVGYLGTVYSPRDRTAWQRLVEPSGQADLRSSMLLWDDVRAGKEMLSRQPATLVHVPLFETDAPLGREQFNELARPILVRTVETTRAVIAQARVAPQNVTGLFLVGGSSRIPLAATLLHQQLGIAPTVVETPELAVAEGALRSLGLVAAAQPQGRVDLVRGGVGPYAAPGFATGPVYSGGPAYAGGPAPAYAGNPAYSAGPARGPAYAGGPAYGPGQAAGQPYPPYPGAPAGPAHPGRPAPGGGVPGGGVPGGGAPGRAAPGGGAPGRAAPGGGAPGRTAPGGAAPGGQPPGGPPSTGPGSGAAARPAGPQPLWAGSPGVTAPAPPTTPATPGAGGGSGGSSGPARSDAHPGRRTQPADADRTAPLWPQQAPPAGAAPSRTEPASSPFGPEPASSPFGPASDPFGPASDPFGPASDPFGPEPPSVEEHSPRHARPDPTLPMPAVSPTRPMPAVRPGQPLPGDEPTTMWRMPAEEERAPEPPPFEPPPPGPLQPLPPPTAADDDDEDAFEWPDDDAPVPAEGVLWVGTVPPAPVRPAPPRAAPPSAQAPPAAAPAAPVQAAPAAPAQAAPAAPPGHAAPAQAAPAQIRPAQPRREQARPAQPPRPPLQPPDSARPPAASAGIVEPLPVSSPSAAPAADPDAEREELRRALSSVRTRAEVVEHRLEKLPETMSTLRRKFVIPAFQDVEPMQPRAVRQLRTAREMLSIAERQAEAGRWQLVRTAIADTRQALEEATASIAALTGRLAVLEELAADPKGPLEQARFAVRDAQRLFEMLSPGVPAEHGQRLTALAQRVDAVGKALAAPRPNYWELHNELAQVRDRTRETILAMRNR